MQKNGWIFFEIFSDDKQRATAQKTTKKRGDAVTGMRSIAIELLLCSALKLVKPGFTHLICCTCEA
jgi:hypothetical protein